MKSALLIGCGNFLKGCVTFGSCAYKMLHLPLCCMSLDLYRLQSLISIPHQSLSTIFLLFKGYCSSDIFLNDSCIYLSSTNTSESLSSHSYSLSKQKVYFIHLVWKSYKPQSQRNNNPKMLQSFTKHGKSC